MVKTKDGHYTEEFHVLKSNKAIRHGSFKKLDDDKRILLTGFHKNGLKDSLWTAYYKWSGVTKNTGMYSNDTKVGEWKYYDQKGELIQTYDYSKNELVSFKNEDPERKFLIKTAQGTEEMKLERPLMYLGGMDEALSEIVRTIKYPGEAVDAGTSGMVIIAFFVDKEGRATEHQVHTGIGHGCDEEALRVVETIPDNWLPGVLNGEEVVAQFLFPVRFTLR
jgi:TonB family protein